MVKVSRTVAYVMVVKQYKSSGYPRVYPDQSLALLLAEKEYEALKPLFRRLFCTPATSAAVERVFSTNIMRPHRAHMSNSLLETFMFLKCNSDL